MSKCLSFLALPKARDILPPLQVGVGLSNGAEAIIHSVNLISSDPDIPSSTFCLLVDFSNAFNSIDRSSLFLEVRKHFPSLSPWIESCYGVNSNLPFGVFMVPSVQQGDHLGPVLFSILLNPVVDRISTEVPSLELNGWYLDGVLCGSPDDLSLALSILEEAGPHLGLHLKRSKSLLFSPDPALPLPSSLADIPFSCEGFVLLGAPVGSLAFRRTVISERFVKIKSLVSLFPSLEDSQVEFSFLRSCLSLPKLLCAHRTFSPEVLSPIFCEFDSAMFKVSSDLIGGAGSHWARFKTSLPVRLGGLGLRQAGIHSPAAFISSVHACDSLILSLSGLSVHSAYTSSALHALCTGLGWAPSPL